jgi:sigma-E factor negative regulatory protein RseA
MAKLPAGLPPRGLRAGQPTTQLRSDWHAYHLIGDVLRSDELASRTGPGCGLHARLRAALATNRCRWRRPRCAAAPVPWLAPAAVAAGFAVPQRWGGLCCGADKAGPTGWDSPAMAWQTPGMTSLRRAAAARRTRSAGAGVG